jgi:hypothetical protein
MATEEIWCLYDPWIRDGEKNQDPGSGSESVMNNKDHISKRAWTQLFLG